MHEAHHGEIRRLFARVATKVEPREGLVEIFMSKVVTDIALGPHDVCKVQLVHTISLARYKSYHTIQSYRSYGPFRADMPEII